MALNMQLAPHLLIPRSGLREPVGDSLHQSYGAGCRPKERAAYVQSEVLHVQASGTPTHPRLVHRGELSLGPTVSEAIGGRLDV